MDFVVAILLKALYTAAKNARLLDHIASLPEKTAEAVYEKLVQDKLLERTFLRRLFEPKLDKLVDRAFESVAPKNANLKRRFLLRALTDPAIVAVVENLGRSELPTRAVLVPIFRAILPGADAAVVTDRFVETLYDGLRREQEIVNHIILLLSEKEQERHQTLIAMLQEILRQLAQPRVAVGPAVAPSIPTTTLTIELTGLQENRFEAALKRGETTLVPPRPTAIPAGFAWTYNEHLQALATGAIRGWSMPVTSRDQLLDRMGQQLAAFLLPGEIGKQVHDAIAAAKNERVEIIFRARDSRLLSLSIEAVHDPVVHLPLVLYPHVAVGRCLTGDAARPVTAISGPLRLLVLIGSPDEEKTREPLLDLERELRTILDAVDKAMHGGNCIVEILEEGSLENLAAKLDAEPFHVVHISCHGRPGVLIWEDEDGNPVEVTASKLADTIAATDHPQVPLIVLASCLTGVAAENAGEADTGSFAAQLVDRGIPAVLAMQHPVSDWYATELAGQLYRHLADDEIPSPLWALTKARRQVEERRRQRREREPAGEGMEPEYATPALYLNADCTPLFDRRQPFDRGRRQPQLAVVPGLCLRRVGDFIGRRRQQRQLRRCLTGKEKPGAVITGMGGVGKSALASHLVENLVREGWLPVTVVGHTNETEICRMVGDQLWRFAEQRQLPDDHALRRLATPLRAVFTDDRQCRPALLTLLQQLPVLLLLDNFEDNLAADRQTFLDPELESFLQILTELPLAARLLMTCCHPLPGFKHSLLEIPLGPLSVQEMRKLLLRLPNLKDLDSEARLTVYRKVGGHPRLLEFLDAILGGGEARFADVNRRLDRHLQELNLAPVAPPETLDTALQTAVVAGCRDILLDELITLVQRHPGDRDLLVGDAVYETPVDLAGLAFQRFERPATKKEEKSLRASANRLANLSLLAMADSEAYFVHH